jgi:phosphohistidine swiveling domain-containing protein
MLVADPGPAAAVPVLTIDAGVAGNPGYAGAKAARQAQARVAGLPVLDSLIVPCAVSEPVLAAATAQLGSCGVHACRLDVMGADRTPLARLPDLAATLGPALAVRSSSPLEGGAESAGAFASLIGVTPDEVPTAVLAVWASAITGDHPLAPMGVLIQPELTPSWAGLAERGGGGDIKVTATPGPAGALMAGWSTGATATVRPGGAVIRMGGGGPEPAEAVVLTVATLAAQTYAALGDDVIEWALVDEQIWLLQSRRAARPARLPGQAGLPEAGSGSLPVPARVIGRAAAYAGDLAERWLLPWALAWDGDVAGPGEAARISHPAAAWTRLTALAAELTSQVWAGQPVDGPELAAGLRALRGPADDAVIGRLDALVPPDPELAGRAIRLWRDLAAYLAAAGAISAPDHLGALPADLPAWLAGRPGQPARGRDTRQLAQQAALRWEAALYRAVSTGPVTQGAGVSEGTGCGRAVLADEVILQPSGQPAALPVRPVIVARYPLPRYSPLLMHAAGLVTAGGSEAAHLVSVARALGVPAVIGCDVTPLPGPRSYLAVDGEAGTVATLGV